MLIPPASPLGSSSETPGTNRVESRCARLVEIDLEWSAVNASFPKGSLGDTILSEEEEGEDDDFAILFWLNFSFDSHASVPQLDQRPFPSTRSQSRSRAPRGPPLN